MLLLRPANEPFLLALLIQPPITPISTVFLSTWPLSLAPLKSTLQPFQPREPPTELVLELLFLLAPSIIVRIPIVESFTILIVSIVFLFVLTHQLHYQPSFFSFSSFSSQGFVKTKEVNLPPSSLQIKVVAFILVHLLVLQILSWGSSIQLVLSIQ